MARRVLALLLVASATACTPEEISSFLDVTAPAREAAEAKGWTAERADRLVECESGGNPEAVSPTGRFRGLLQFDRVTWNSVTSRWFPHWHGHDPAAVPYEWQIAAGWALWAERGPQPWPVCGR